MSAIDVFGDRWKCPDCCKDLDEPAYHPRRWHFCPFTGRPRGVLHITPRTLQGRFRALMEDAERLGVADLVIGLLSTQLEAIRGIESSYLGGAAQFVTEPETDLGGLGGRLSEIVERRLEIRDYLGDLLVGDRGKQRYDGKPVPALGGTLKD